MGSNEDNSQTLILHTTNGTNWSQVNHPFHSGILNAVHFSNAQNGRIVGQDDNTGSPISLKTSNGGATWTEVNVPVASGEFKDVFFTGPDSGAVVGSSGSDGVVCRTADGGATWDVKIFQDDQLPENSRANTSGVQTAAD